MGKFPRSEGDTNKKGVVHTEILPIFTEASNTPAMVKNCLTVIMELHVFANPGDNPWVTADQPLFALFKTIQWGFPDTRGEYLIIAAWICVCQVANSSGGPRIMAGAGVTTLGVAESSIHCAHISRTSYLNIACGCVLYMMLKDFYQVYVEYLPPTFQPIDIGKWCEVQKSPMFRFYYLLLQLKLLVLQFVQSVRSANIDISLASITNIIYYFFALNHYNYSRWVPVHIPDMLNKYVDGGRFTVKKTGNCFQTLALTMEKSRM